jgi:hypothetical protein
VGPAGKAPEKKELGKRITLLMVIKRYVIIFKWRVNETE